jgi:NitT/TauT family transport system permease protein/taurine transport system permease protein/sulfonate transport system permease protein
MRARKRSYKRLLLPAIGIFALFAIWEIGALSLQATSDNAEIRWPTLEYVVTESLPGIGTVGEERLGLDTQVGSQVGGGGLATESGGSYTKAFHLLWRESWITLKRVLVGAAVGIVLGVLLGMAIALTRFGQRLFSPIVNLVRQFPLLALTYLFLIWFGGAERGVYVFIIFGVATMVVVNTVNAVQNVSPIHVRFARTLGADRARIARTVVLPAMLPELMAGVKVAVGLAWPMALAAEYLGAQEGLGRLMLAFELFQFTGRMVVVLWMFIFWALLTYLVVTLAGNYLTRWAPRTTTA